MVSALPWFKLSPGTPCCVLGYDTTFAVLHFTQVYKWVLARVETTTMSTWRHKRGTSFSWTMSCKLLFFLSFHFLRTRFSIKRLFCFLCLITLPTLPPLTGTYNQNIHVYDVNSYQSIKALVGHIGTVTGLAPAVAGKLLFSASYDTTVQVQSRDTFIVTAKY